ncbi:MAG TPA: transposase [Acidobacteriaceae bacterium]|nr:transposase [Acidobacteriaceae bacterium]
MAIPRRHVTPDHIRNASRTFFVTTKTTMGKAVLQTDRNAALLVDVLRRCVASKRFILHDFVIMPNHIHLLLELGSDISIEKAIQYVKGGFSFRMKRENGYRGEIWQRGFSEVRILDEISFCRHREYIAQNPVTAGLVSAPEEFRWSYTWLAAHKTGAKAQQC